MSRPVVTQLTQTQCPHAAMGTLTTSTTKVMIDNAPALALGDKGTVAGCPFTLPNGKPQPCVTEMLLGVSGKVMAEGKFVLLQNPSDLCYSAENIPQGPVGWTNIQMKVLAA